MPSPSVLNVEDLLAPIPGENPAGAPYDADFTVEQDLNAARKDYEPHPTGPVPKKPEWDKIVRIAVKQLTEKSKDLRLATRLTEALIKQHGFGGLRDGFALLASMVEQCWDRLFPSPDPDMHEGMEIRADLLMSTLSDPEGGLTFPHTIRSTPVVEIDGKPRSLYDKRMADEGREGLDFTRGDFERAKVVDPNVAEDIDQAVAELHRLIKALNDKLDGQGPSLSKLEESLLECRQLVRHIVGEPQPEAQTAAEASNGTPAPGTSSGGLPGRVPLNRDDAYRQLAQIANVLEQFEPHSPIPDLLRRCVELGKMPFRVLIREIVRDQNLLTEVRREFGIKEPPAES